MVPVVGAVTCTCTGATRSVLVPSPSWPCRLEPQLNREPSALSATVCAPPAATLRHGALTVTGVLPTPVPMVMLLPLTPQVRPVDKALVLLSVKVPVATNCWVVPMAIVKLAGVTAIDTSVGVVVVVPLDALPPPPPPQAASTASKGINNRWRKLKA